MNAHVDLADLPALLTPAEVCDVLRRPVRSPAKAIRGLQRRGLRVIEDGRRLLVLRQDLEAYIAALADGDGRWD
ncbi:MAG: hypothetical protein R6X20_00140 [Phycisphaerae bacterium]